MQDQSPVNPLPPVIVAVFLAIAVIEAAFSLGATGVIGGARSVGWRVGAIDSFAFAPRVLELITQGRGDLGLFKRFVTYPFVHGSFTHAAFAAVLWLALGKFVAEAYGQARTLAIFAISVVLAAVIFGVYGMVAGVNPPLYGAYPGVYGMIGAFTYLTWLRLGQTGGNQMYAFRLIGVLMILQMVFAALFGGDSTWIADLAGFVVGGMAAIGLAPGGWHAFVTRMRQR